MNRRHFMRSAAASLMAGGLPLQAPAQPDSKPPNILFIMADDLGIGDLGCYGQLKIQTPHMDALSAQGTRFTNVYAGHAVCAPSRCVLMTGLHTGHCRVRGNSGKFAPKHDGEAGRIPLAADDFTVGQLLQSAGYATGMAGKWGLGEPGSTGLPNDHGFDEWFGYLNQNHAPDYFTDYLWRNKDKQWIAGNQNRQRQIYSCDLFTDFAEKFIRENKDRPFFLYLPYTIPHAELEVPDLGPYKDKPWTEQQKTFAAMVTRLDDYVGRLMALLDELRLVENTYVFFTSDNGASNTEIDFFDRTGPLRNHKGSLYEGGIRVPMMVRCPGPVPAATVNDSPWYFADFLPTAAAIAQTAPPKGLDGINVLPTLKGAVQPELQTRAMYWETHDGGGLAQAARQGNWKGFRHSPASRMEIYNLADDPSESNDVASQQKERASQFAEFLDASHTDSPHWPVTR